MSVVCLDKSLGAKNCSGCDFVLKEWEGYCKLWEKEAELNHKCPMYNQGICEKAIIPMCKFNSKKCFVNLLVYSLFLKEIRERD